MILFVLNTLIPSLKVLQSWLIELTEQMDNIKHMGSGLELLEFRSHCVPHGRLSRFSFPQAVCDIAVKVKELNKGHRKKCPFS